MDTSELYIEMCEKAEEIQQKWYVRIGDEYYDPIEEHHVTIGSDDDQNLGTIQGLMKGKAIWLPRQDQLQEMVYPSEKCFAKLERLWNWWQLPENKVGYCESIEQLWLAFVMKERFNKVWDGKEWVRG